MSSYRLLPTASEEFFEILANILEHRGSAAMDELALNFTSAFRLIAENPGLGHRRSDLSQKPYFFYFMEPFFIIYIRRDKPLSIAAIIHSSRDIPQMLRTRT